MDPAPGPSILLSYLLVARHQLTFIQVKGVDVVGFSYTMLGWSTITAKK